MPLEIQVVPADNRSSLMDIKFLLAETPLDFPRNPLKNQGLDKPMILCIGVSTFYGIGFLLTRKLQRKTSFKDHQIKVRQNIGLHGP